jgi:putative toxin-antitoxin system antitoxin component (TIGR02293 family)
MIDVAAVAAILYGGQAAAAKRVRSMDELRVAVEAGLPKQALARTVAYAVTDPGEARRVSERLVPPATLRRRGASLSPAESERVARLARVAATAEQLLGDAAEARDFLATPHLLLGDQRPLDIAQSELGARQVEDVLWRMAYGIPV